MRPPARADAAVPADYYELLGVGRDAATDDLKRAYRRLARTYHPDANSGDAASEARFKEISEAYAVLSDAEARSRYDRFGHEGLRGGAGGAPFDFDLSSIFDSFFGGNPFGGPSGPTGPPRGADQETVVELAFADAVFGADVTVALRSAVACGACDGEGTAPGTRRSRCGACDGAGQVRQVRNSVFGRMVTAAPCGRCGGTGEEIADPCRACRGAGVRTEKLSHTLTVPPGVASGSTLRVTGRGHAGERGGRPGDLYVHLSVSPSDRFERDGRNLVAALPLTMLQAALGTRVEFETLDGVREVVVRPGTQPGDVVRLRGLGVPRSDGRGRGDLALLTVVEIPRKLPAGQAAALAEVARERAEPVGEN
ncbi:MAG TPA: molecular chaperone DnaJ, partial [Acidimicrobiaceae bacterium]|nr:molecular chaperone DnaJ [Acidimicrobiaceae bacterium]